MLYLIEKRLCFHFPKKLHGILLKIKINCQYSFVWVTLTWI